MSNTTSSFDKYDQMGAYHWIECDKNSKRYNPPLEARYQVLINKISNVGSLLDIGCGDGYLIGQIAKYCEQIEGIDPEQNAILWAERKLQEFSNCRVREGSCYSLPFDSHLFDIVTMSDVIEHIEHPDKSLQEIVRVLRPSGALMLTTPKWRPDRIWDKHHVQEFKPEELKKLLGFFFSSVDLTFFWPLKWSDWYSTKLGWRLIPLLCRYFYNPFLQEGLESEKFGQILAICKNPIL